jgi:AcrR family transcriptional regulator
VTANVEHDTDEERERTGRPTTKRDLQKLETKARILDAARALFVDVGYTETTVRMIAERAGVAAGTLFVSFEGKADLLLEILVEVFEDMESAALTTESQTPLLLERMVGWASEGFRHAAERPKLLSALIGQSWMWSDSLEERNAKILEPILARLTKWLNEAKADGQLAPTADMMALRSILWTVCLQTMRLATYGSADRAQMTKVFRRQAAALLRP